MAHPLFDCVEVSEVMSFLLLNQTYQLFRPSTTPCLLSFQKLPTSLIIAASSSSMKLKTAKILITYTTFLRSLPFGLVAHP